jgi:hypothetical protein
MKKLFGIIVGLLLMVGLQAQTSGTTYTLASGQTYYNAFSYATHTATALRDSIAGTGEKYWIFNINKSQLYYYQFFVEYDTVLIHNRVDGNNIIVWLDASVDGTTYVNIDSTSFESDARCLPAAMATAANATLCAMNLKDVTTGVLYRYLKIKAAGLDANKCALITKLAVKVGIRY